MADACAACEKGGEGLKFCAACKLVKYCGRECQAAHRPAHKRACKQRAAELYDEKLFAEPPPREDCPVCFLPMPFFTDSQEQYYQACCGKAICIGCYVQMDWFCPFCRTPDYETDEELIQMLMRRIDANDPGACNHLGCIYNDGVHGMAKDTNKAMELWHRAVELGHTDALNNIAGSGFSAGTLSLEKTRRYFEQAAMTGSAKARYNIGALEQRCGNFARAYKHWMISARAGHPESMDHVRRGFLHPCLRRGPLITKEQYETTLCAWKQSTDEMKSENRDRYLDHLRRNAEEKTAKRA